MKAGDKVWMLDVDDIVSLIVEADESDALYVSHTVKGVSDEVISREVFRVKKPYPYFPTREALCEHYRKIFE